MALLYILIGNDVLVVLFLKFVFPRKKQKWHISEQNGILGKAFSGHYLNLYYFGERGEAG